MALIEQQWSLYLDCWPDRDWVDLPLGPVVGLDAVRLYSPDDTFVTLDTSLFLLDRIGLRPRLVRREVQAWPAPGRSANACSVARRCSATSGVR